MRNPRMLRSAVCVAVLGAVLVAPVSGASASDASIKAVIKSYSPRILVAEGHVLTAIGRYKKSGNPSAVKSALATSISVFGSLKSKIAAQSASSTRVRAGQAKFEKGLQKVILAYRSLQTAFGEKRASPTAAKAEAKKALRAVKAGHKEIVEGAKLLS
jgi:hypothetical protein